MTERAEASEALSTQIVNSLTAGLLVVDRAGFVRIINPAGQKMLGVDASLEGTLISALPPAAAPLVTIVNQCLTTGEAIVRRTVEVPHANDVTHLGVTATRLDPSEGNTVGGVICLFSDLTAVIALEEQLRLKETLAQLGELTAGIAHEFRNGLATIHGYGKLIDPGALPAQYKPYIEGIRQETEALGQVVTNFLNFARPTQLSLATQISRPWCSARRMISSTTFNSLAGRSWSPASSGGWTPTMCCCGRRSATCSETPLRPVSLQG